MLWLDSLVDSELLRRLVTVPGMYGMVGSHVGLPQMGLEAATKALLDAGTQVGGYNSNASSHVVPQA